MNQQKFIEGLCAEKYSPAKHLKDCGFLEKFSNVKEVTDPDISHDEMMDTAAEVIDHCGHYEDFWQEMEQNGMTEDHAQNLWADHIDNQNDKWGKL